MTSDVVLHVTRPTALGGTVDGSVGDAGVPGSVVLDDGTVLGAVLVLPDTVTLGEAPACGDALEPQAVASHDVATTIPAIHLPRRPRADLDITLISLRANLDNSSLRARQRGRIRELPRCTPVSVSRSVRPGGVDAFGSAAVISIFEIITAVLIIDHVLIDAVRWLRESGLEVEDLTPLEGTGPGIDAILEVSVDSHSARFAVQVKSRPPYPHELDRLQQPWHELAARGHPLIAAPFISEPLGSTLTKEGWSWADAQGNFDLRAPGFVLRQRRATSPPSPKRRSLPRGSGSFAIIRALVDFSKEDEEPGASALAARAGVSQPRASQILHQLYELKLVDRSGHGRWEPHREPLLDRFLAEYSGPGGSELYYYSLDSPVDVAVRAGRVSATGRPVLVSADVGPDLILPWRRPSLVILYTGHAIDPSDLKLTEAHGRHDANVILRTPEDRSVLTARALVTQIRGDDVPLADPLQQIWDLQDLGGADRIEAAGRLRQWLLKRP